MMEEREKTETAPKRRNAPVIMMRLMRLVRPLLGIMAAAVILGTVGYLCAIFLTILAGRAILCGLMTDPALPFSVTTGSTRAGNISLTQILSVMTGIAVCRGILHYAEQYCNHFRNVFSLVLLAIYGRMSYKNYRKF